MEFTSIKFKEFLKRYSISIVVSTMKIDSYSFSQFISDNISQNVKIITEIPKDNFSDYLIFNPRDSSQFQELLHSKLLNRKYTKYPKAIIIVLSFDNLIDMELPFEKISILDRYKIPILYFSISDVETKYKINLVDIEFYEDSLRLNSSDEDDVKYLHISNIMTFKSRLISSIKSGNLINVFCYYTEENKNEWEKIIKECQEIDNFYDHILNSNGKILSYEDNELYVK